MIPKALEIMGAEDIGDGYSFGQRVKAAFKSGIYQGVDDALFIHEAKAFLREKGMWRYESTRYATQTHHITTVINGLFVNVSAPTEHEAWAKAVIAVWEQ